MYQDEWVVCRIFHKRTGSNKRSPISSLLRMNSFGDELFDSTSLPYLLDVPHYFNNTNTPNSSYSIDGENESKGTTTSTTVGSNAILPNNNNFSYLHTNMNDQQSKSFSYQGGHNQYNNTITTMAPNSSTFYQIPPLNPFFSSSNLGLFQSSSGLSTSPVDQAILRALASTSTGNYGLKSRDECKVEQFSSNHSVGGGVSLSQDTGLSTDRNTEISSVVSKHEMGISNRSGDDQDLDGPSSSATPGLGDFDCLWNY